MTTEHNSGWNRDVKIPAGKPDGGFTIDTGVEVNQLHNEPVSPKEMEREIKVTDRDIGVLFPSLLSSSKVDPFNVKKAKKILL